METDPIFPDYFGNISSFSVLLWKIFPVYFGNLQFEYTFSNLFLKVIVLKLYFRKIQLNRKNIIKKRFND